MSQKVKISKPLDLTSTVRIKCKGENMSIASDKSLLNRSASQQHVKRLVVQWRTTLWSNNIWSSSIDDELHSFLPRHRQHRTRSLSWFGSINFWYVVRHWTTNRLTCCWLHFDKAVTCQMSMSDAIDIFSALHHIYFMYSIVMYLFYFNINVFSRLFFIVCWLPVRSK